MRYVLPLCAVLSLALHAVVLSARFSPEPPGRAANATAGSSTTMRVRTVSPLPHSLVPLPIREDLQPIETLHASDRTPTAVTEPATGVSPAAPPPSAVAEFDSDNYVPRIQLSTPPAAKTPVVLESPPGEMTTGRLVGILLLFIDEQGHVQHIDAEEPTLPPAFERAAREAFEATEFAPGEVNGRAVKSRQRVEVVFDNTPLAMR